MRSGLPRSLKAYGKARAAEYDKLIKVAGYGTYAHLLEAVNSALTLHPLPEKALVVDLGCGTGNLSARILRDFPGVSITGVDGSESMLARAAARFRRRPVGLLCRDFSRDGWADGLPAADAVVSSGAIHHLADARKRRLYGRIRGLLKPGGIFVAGDIIKGDTARARVMYEDFWVTMIMKGLRRHPGSGPERAGIKARHRSIQANEGDRPGRLRDHLDWLRQSGFSSVECYWKLFGFAVFGGVRA